MVLVLLLVISEAMEVGLIGCGDMGKLYARKFVTAKYRYTSHTSVIFFR